MRRFGLLPALLVVLAACAAQTATVPRLTISNDTDYEVDVQVAGEAREGWVPLGVLEPHSQRVVEEIADQGEVWVFRFRHFGDPVGELSVPRAELEAGGWRVEVPPEIADRVDDPPAEAGTPEP
ncbi:MAG: hypothetical protein ACRDI0_04165 [Actinomycetota bacterium]